MTGFIHDYAVAQFASRPVVARVGGSCRVMQIYALPMRRLGIFRNTSQDFRRIKVSLMDAVVCIGITEVCE